MELLSARAEAQVPPDDRRRVLVVVLNFNGLDDTLECLTSLARQTHRHCKVLVIDNGSVRGDLSQITARFPEVEVLALRENLGWAGGNNVGLRRAVHDGFAFVCLLNNDTILEPDAIAQLLAASDAVPAPCLMQPLSRQFDDPSIVQGNPTLPLDAADPVVRRLAIEHEVAERDDAYGACLLFATELVDRVGELDERFFLQLEETDYYRRARDLGVRSYSAFRAQMLHKESVSFGARFTPTKTYYRVRNSLLLSEKHDRTSRQRLQAARVLLWSLRRESAASTWFGFLRWLLSGNPTAQAAREGVRDYVARRFGKRRTG